VAGGVARHVDHLEADAQGFDRLAAGHALQRLGHGLEGRSDDAGAGGFAQLGHAAGVVGMVVGEQDAAELQAFLGEPRLDRRGVAGVDHPGVPTVVQGPDVVVGEGGQGM